MAYTIALIHPAQYPVTKYGGTERVVWWLAKGLNELGHQVKLVALPGSKCPFAEIVPSIPSSADLLHFFNTPSQEPEKPYLVTIEGNGKPGEEFFRNTVFVSQNHAERHGSQCFVYNGLDPADYIFAEKKDESLLFLAKASWRVKNVKGAIQVSRKTGRELNVLGGNRWWLPSWRGVHWRGMLGGREKSIFLSRAQALLFPVLWHEPFGIAVTEALISGTPVLATPFGSLKELVHPEVGRVCSSYREFIESVSDLQGFSPTRCRDWALSQFHYLEMTRKYLNYYEMVLGGKSLNEVTPKAGSKSIETFFDFS